MELICLDCGNIFYDCEAVHAVDITSTPVGTIRTERSVCPACGSDDLEEAAHCRICGGTFREDELINLRHKTPLEIRSLGVRLSFVPEDRLGMGLVGSMDITDNMMLRSYRKGPAAFLDRQKPRRQAEDIIRELDVSTPGTSTPVRRLSGGNVQKVLVGREIAFTPKVLMAAYPVRGLDIHSSYTIYHLLNRQKENGVAVIYVGEDLDVLLGLCDRILVINGGAVTGLVDARSATKEEIGLLMTKTGEREGETS